MEEISKLEFIEEEIKENENTPKKRKKKKSEVKQEAKIETVQQENEDTKAEEYKSKKCKVLLSNKNSIVVDFDGRCIGFKKSKNENIEIVKGMVEVKYLGKIGTKDFSVKLK